MGLRTATKEEGEEGGPNSYHVTKELPICPLYLCQLEESKFCTEQSYSCNPKKRRKIADMTIFPFMKEKRKVGKGRCTLKEFWSVRF